MKQHIILPDDVAPGLITCDDLVLDLQGFDEVGQRIGDEQNASP